MLITLLRTIIQINNTTSKPDDLLGLDVNGMAYRKRWVRLINGTAVFI